LAKLFMVGGKKGETLATLPEQSSPVRKSLPSNAYTNSISVGKEGEINVYILGRNKKAPKNERKRQGGVVHVSTPGGPLL